MTTTSASDARNKRLRDIGIAIGIGLTVLGIVIFMGLRFAVATEAQEEVLKIGAPAPDFNLPLTSGGTVTLTQLKGKPVWINFWATWCPPCRTEMPDLQKSHDANSPARYTLLAIDYGEDEADVRRFLNDVGFTLPVAFDPSGDIAVQYRVLGLPTHVFIDKDGIVRDIYVGILTPDQMEQRAEELW